MHEKNMYVKRKKKINAKFEPVLQFSLPLIR